MKSISEKVKDSAIYRALTYDITVEDIVGSDKYERVKQTKAYKFISDWAGLATNKVILGMYMDAQAGLLPGTSLLARGISLGVHSVTSPAYTVVRDSVYKNGNITPERSAATRYAAELLAFNAVQTPLYVAQIAVAIGIRAALDSSVEFEPETIANGAIEFFKNSWWLAFAGKWSMDGFRRFFGSKTPEEVAENKSEPALEDIIERQTNNGG